MPWALHSQVLQAALATVFWNFDMTGVGAMAHRHNFINYDILYDGLRQGCSSLFGQEDLC